MPRLLRHAGAASVESFRENYGRVIGEALDRRTLMRDAIWTESLAVGSQEFATRVGGSVRSRMSVDRKPRGGLRALCESGRQTRRQPDEGTGASGRSGLAHVAGEGHPAPDMAHSEPLKGRFRCGLKGPALMPPKSEFLSLNHILLD